MSMENDKSPSRRSVWLRILLGASLALNLLVLGLAIGAVLRFGGPDGARRPPPVLGAALYRELPREDRRAYRKAMQELPNVRGPDRKTAARQIAQLLRATPFDPDALGTLLGEYATRRDKWHAMAGMVLLEQVDQMSENERMAYADRIEEALSRDRHRSRKHREKRD